MFRVFSISFLFFVCTKALAQSFTLQQCIDSALAHNIPVKQSGLLSESAAVNLGQARYNRLPAIGSNIFHGVYNGRSIDPATNNYINNNFNRDDYQLNGSVVLFNAGNINNLIKQNAAAYEASRMEWQQAKDNLVLNVILAYLQVLNSEDVVASAKNQAAVSQKQLERLDVLNQQGAIKPSEYTDVKGQLMNDELAIVNAQNTLESSKLALSQLMNRPYNKAMKLERIDVNEFLTAYIASADQVYQNALQQFSLVKAVESRRQSFVYGSKAARRALFPTLSFEGSMYTYYSNTFRTATGKVPYDTQLENNMSRVLGLNLSIPIFNRMQQRNRVKLADIQLKNSELEEDRIKVQLRQDIEQAHLNMTNAFERYRVLQEQVAAYKESFQAAEARYNSGVGTSIDYLTAKDRLDRATINLISAQYDFVLRKKILDYYNNSNAANR